MRAGAQGDHGLAWRQVLGLGENIFPLVVHSLLLSRLLPARAWHPWGPGPASYFSPGEHRKSLGSLAPTGEFLAPLQESRVKGLPPFSSPL